MLKISKYKANIDYNWQMSDFMKLRNLKKADPVGYGYLVKADRLISKYTG